MFLPQLFIQPHLPKAYPWSALQFSYPPVPTRRSALTETFDVFLSHNSKDKERVREIADALQKKDVKVWLDERELTPGRRWIPELERQIQAALAIDQASFGNEHPRVAVQLNNLALLLQDTNRLDEAEPLMRRAVEIFERSLVPDHPSTQAGRRNLEILLREIAGGQGRPELGSSGG